MKLKELIDELLAQSPYGIRNHWDVQIYDSQSRDQYFDVKIEKDDVEQIIFIEKVKNDD